MKEEPEQILDLRSQLGWLGRESWLPRLAFRLLNSLLGFDQVNRHLREAKQHDDDSIAEYYESVRKSFGYEFELTGPGWNIVPPSGPVIIASNHPFGGPDALGMIHSFIHRREDSVIIANSFLNRMRDGNNAMIPVDILANDSESRAQNARSIREVARHLKAGGLLCLFPSGEVAHWSLKKRKIVEASWSPLLGSLAKQSGATVMPLQISGRNSILFHFFGLIHPFLRTAWLGRQILRQRGNRIALFLGEPVEIDDSRSKEKVTQSIQEQALRQDLP